jgi:hypothetical protein
MEVIGKLHSPAALFPLYPLGRAGLDGMEKRKILHCRESNPDRPTERYTD